MPRRGNNIYKRKDGRWEGRIQKGEVDGHRQYKSVYGPTYAEVKKKMEQFKANGPEEEREDKCTMGGAAEIWLKERGPNWKKTTYATYHNMVWKYILPQIGNVCLDSVDAACIEGFLLRIRAENELSNNYLHNICAVIIRIMKYMRRRHGYKTNVPENDVPIKEHGEKEISAEKNLAILEQYLIERTKKNDSTCLGVLIVLNTGLRIGEVCALTWESIDLEKELIFVRGNLQRVKAPDGQKNNTEILLQSPKTAQSQRAIPIPPVLLPLLREQMKNGGDFLIKGRKKPWAEPRTLQYRFARILAACGLDKFNFHMLRHAFATRCIEKGFDVKSLSEILGHSNIQITLKLYVHSSMLRKKELMGQFRDGFYS